MYLSPLSQVLSAGVRVGVAALVLLLTHGPVHSAPLGTVLTHKGEYKPSGTAVTGVFDFQIVLFNVATVGTAISTVTRKNVQVTQRNFTVEVDYGAPPFATATQYWLETRVRAGTSTGAFTTLVPRQKLNAVPYALNVRTLPPGDEHCPQCGRAGSDLGQQHHGHGHWHQRGGADRGQPHAGTDTGEWDLCAGHEYASDWADWDGDL